MKRTKKKSASDSSAVLHDEAYHWQHGQFYPEYHAANVRRLREQYPDRSLAEIDAVYREACRIDDEVRKWIGTSQLSPGARELLLEWLEQQFPAFPRKTLSAAIAHGEPPNTI